MAHVVVAFGHSFMEGLNHHFQHQSINTPELVAKSMNIDKHISKLLLVGKSGAGSQNLMELYNSLPSEIKDKIRGALIDIASNEIATDSSPNNLLLVLNRIMDFANFLKAQGVRQVMIAQILPRSKGLKVSTTQFSLGMGRFNGLLQSWCDSEEFFHYWVHVGFKAAPIMGPPHKAWSKDGIHPNSPKGRRLYKASVKYACFKAIQEHVSKKQTRGGKKTRKAKAKAKLN